MTYVIVLFNRKARCPRCRHPEFTKGEAFDGRPDFQCTNCDQSWTCGHTGGKYLALAERATKRAAKPSVPCDHKFVDYQCEKCGKGQHGAADRDA